MYLTNKKIGFKKTIIIVFVLAFLFGCAKNVRNFDYGNVDNNLYKNSFFKFEMNLPVGWQRIGAERREQMMKNGQEIVAGDDQNLKAALKASEVNTANLLTIFKYPQGTPVKSNPSMALVVENLKNFPGIKTGDDYLFHARRLFKKSNFKYDYISETTEKVVFGGKDFYAMGLSVRHLDVEIKQIYLSTIVNGFSVNFILTYVDDEDRDILFQSLQSIEFY